MLPFLKTWRFSRGPLRSVTRLQSFGGRKKRRSGLKQRFKTHQLPEQETQHQACALIKLSHGDRAELETREVRTRQQSIVVRCLLIVTAPVNSETRAQQRASSPPPGPDSPAAAAAAAQDLLTSNSCLLRTRPQCYLPARGSTGEGDTFQIGCHVQHRLITWRSLKYRLTRKRAESV